MQTFEDDVLKETISGDAEKIMKKVKEELTTPKKSGDKKKHHVIGHIPQAGDQLTIQGLVYKVVNSNPLKGMFIAKIIKP